MVHNVMGFVDGENLVTRYEAMLKDGATPKPEVVHVPGVLVWHPAITRLFLCRYTRLSFYQTVVGDTDKLAEVNDQISRVKYEYCEGPIMGYGRLHPRTFKKESRSAKTKSVDINLTVDALRAGCNGQGDVVQLLSGDGDYIPLIDEVMRHGTQVWVCAFSKGLNPQLRHVADEFFDLDDAFFVRGTGEPAS